MEPWEAVRTSPDTPRVPVPSGRAPRQARFLARRDTMQKSNPQRDGSRVLGWHQLMRTSSVHYASPGNRALPLPCPCPLRHARQFGRYACRQELLYVVGWAGAPCLLEVARCGSNQMYLLFQTLQHRAARQTDCYCCCQSLWKIKTQGDPI